MSSFFQSYLATYRKRWGLSQRELATLLGWRSTSAISRCESLERVPTLKAALQIEAIFGVSPKELLPAFYQDAEAAIVERAKELYETLEGRTDARSQEKLVLLAYIIERGQGDADYV